MEWKRTAESATGLRVEDESHSKVCASEVDDDSLLDMKICSWAKVPTDVDRSVARFVVICDEAHSMQSMQAARTRDTLQLVQRER